MLLNEGVCGGGRICFFKGIVEEVSLESMGFIVVLKLVIGKGKEVL